MSLRQIVAILIAAVLLVFVGGNFETARVWFIGVRVEMPLAFVILISAALGAASALLWSWYQGRKGTAS